MKVTGYELRKSGYIEEDGTERYDTCVFEAKTKEECIEYAKKHNIDPDEHFINTMGVEIIHGLKVPTTINDFPEYLNIILNSHQSRHNI